MGFVLSADIGSTNLKAGVVDSLGRLLSLVEQPLNIQSPESGAAVHDPEQLFRAFTSAARKAVHGYAQRIDGLVLSAYNMSVIAVDKGFRPLTPVITLLDTRSRETFPALKRRCDTALLYRNTGCPSLFHYPFAKIWWLKRKSPSLIRKTRYFLGVKDYLISRLLGFPLADSSTASASQMFNIHRLDWDLYALGLLGLNKDRMPPLVDADKVAGIVPASRARVLGISRDLPLVPGLYDGGAVSAGLGAWNGRNVGVLNMGTTAMLRIVTDRPVLDRGRQMLFSATYLCGKKWFVGGGVNNAGSVAQWISQKLFRSDLKTLTREAGSIPAGSEGLLMLPF